MHASTSNSGRGGREPGSPEQPDTHTPKQSYPTDGSLLKRAVWRWPATDSRRRPLQLVAFLRALLFGTCTGRRCAAWGRIRGSGSSSPRRPRRKPLGRVIAPNGRLSAWPLCALDPRRWKRALAAAWIPCHSFLFFISLCLVLGCRTPKGEKDGGPIGLAIIFGRRKKLVPKKLRRFSVFIGEGEKVTFALLFVCFFVSTGPTRNKTSAGIRAEG